ncbi:MAG: hypothetical protein JWM11_6947 [Planctomycetaceae bacterium]|nr:hypothetical protein [Planctomycetaceae bacterium]
MQFSPTAVTASNLPSRRARGLAWRLGGALTCAALVTGALAQGDAPAPAAGGVGLKGLLPASAPDGLLDTLATLPESWKEWSDGVSADLTKFYGDTAADIAGQTAALENLKAKVGVLEKALADSQYAPIKGPLVSLKSGLIRRIEIITAVLDTLSADPAVGTATAVDATKQSLTAAIDTAEGFLDGLKGGDGWKTFLQMGSVRSALAEEKDAGKLLEALTAVNAKAQQALNSEDVAVKEFVAHKELSDYIAKLGSVVAALNRAKTGVNMDEVRAQLKALLDGLEKYESTGTTAAATQVRAAFSKIREQAADNGERLSTVLRQYYFNYNMQIGISEGFFNRVLAKTHIEEGGVNDFILGADVYGCQITSTQSKFDILASPNGARFRVLLTGTVKTNTDSHKGSVVIYSNGSHTIEANKDVIFDGEKFSTSPANMFVNASNEPVDASTRADNIPFLNQFFKSAAINAAIRKRPEAEAIAAQRVTSRVGPEFDNEVDNKFGELNQKLQTKVTAPLKAEGLYPESRHYQSTDTQLDLHTRLMAKGELGGSKPETVAVGESDLVYQMHESLINNFLDRLDVAGKTMNEEQLRSLLQDKLSKLLGKTVTFSKKEATPATDDAKQPKAFIFTDKDPIRLKVADGKVNLILRTGFQRDEAQGGNIPPQIVTVPLSFKVEGEDVVITRGDVLVDAVDAPENVAEQVARAGVIKKKLENSIPSKKESRTMKVDKPEGDPVNVNILEIDANDGWVTIRLQ